MFLYVKPVAIVMTPGFRGLGGTGIVFLLVVYSIRQGRFPSSVQTTEPSGFSGCKTWIYYCLFLSTVFSLSAKYGTGPIVHDIKQLQA